MAKVKQSGLTCKCPSKPLSTRQFVFQHKVKLYSQIHYILEIRAVRRVRGGRKKGRKGRETQREGEGQKERKME